MLVLSRRPGEKILFPSVGISVEVMRTKGNTVRVGIEAPEDIRVIRGELEGQPRPKMSSEPTPNLLDLSRVARATEDDNRYENLQHAELGKRIDDIVTALALAQNQQSQGLSGHAEIAIGEAMARLKELKENWVQEKKPDAFVCESKTAYETSHAALVRHVDDRELDQVSDQGFRFDFEFAV